MFRCLSTLCLAVVTAASAHAQATHAWDWTTAERISARLTAAKVERRGANANTGDSELSSQALVARFGIDGSRNPELFLPWELFDSFLARTRLGGSDTVDPRALYEADVALLGWDEDAFWRDMEQLRIEYDAARAEIVALQNVNSPETRLERHARNQRRDEASRLLCAARAQALLRARALYNSFDKFLYTSVAPTLSLTSATPTDGVTLSWIEGGCK